MSYHKTPGRRAGCSGCSVEVPMSRILRELPDFEFPHEPECREKNVTYTDCRTEEGITVGLIDSIITMARLLRSRPLDSRAITEAMKDLRQDPDVLFVLVVPTDDAALSQSKEKP